MNPMKRLLVTRALIKHLKQHEGISELVTIAVRPACDKAEALRTLIEEECDEGSLPASCRKALDTKNGAIWSIVLMRVLKW